MPDRYWFGADGLWHRKGYPDVAPGGLPSNPDPNQLAALRIMDLSLTADSSGPIVPALGYVGACLADGVSNNLAGASTVPTKFGNGAAVRQFLGSDPTVGPFHPTTASRVHTSYKFTDSTINSGSMDDALAALIERTPDGDVIENHHESDNDGLTGTGITNRIAAKNRIYDIAKATKPGVLVAHTMTGGFWYATTSDTTRDVWAATARGDLWGVDWDGFKNLSGPPYGGDPTNAIANAQRYVDRFRANGFIGWTVPEHIYSRQDWDSDGSLRAAWLDSTCNAFVAAGAYMDCAYDYNTTAHNTATNYNRIKVGTPEMAVWQRHVAANPAWS